MVVFTCAGYLATSSLLILLNKFLLSTDGFSYPLMLSGSGMLLSFVGSSILVKIPALVPERQVCRQLPGFPRQRYIFPGREDDQRHLLFFIIILCIASCRRHLCSQLSGLPTHHNQGCNCRYNSSIPCLLLLHSQVFV